MEEKRIDPGEASINPKFLLSQIFQIFENLEKIYDFQERKMGELGERVSRLEAQLSVPTKTEAPAPAPAEEKPAEAPAARGAEPTDDDRRALAQRTGQLLVRGAAEVAALRAAIASGAVSKASACATWAQHDALDAYLKSKGV